MVRVIIERHSKPGKEAELENVFVDLRTKAMKQAGYVSGETLHSVDDRSFWLIVSTWIDANHWEAWKNSRERRDILSKLEPLLATPEKISVFSFMRRGGAESAHKISS